MLTVHFTKLFVGGTLKGMTYDATVTAPDQAHADQYLKRYNNFILLGTVLGGAGFGSPYIITAARIGGVAE